MRSLFPVLSTFSVTSALQIQRHTESFALHKAYTKDPPLRSTALRLTLETEFIKQENITDFESSEPLDIMTLDNNKLLGMEHVSEPALSDVVHESTETNTRVQFGVQPNAADAVIEDKPPNFLGMTPNAIFALNAVAVIWGTQHAVIKLVVDDAEGGAGPFTLVRFAIGALIASLPILKKAQVDTGIELNPEDQSKLMESSVSGHSEEPKQQSPENGTQDTVLRWGTEMGIWMFLGFAFQAIGLATTTAQRSGFLLYLNVKFVPFLAFLLFGRKISIPTLASAFTAFGGTALLAYDGTSLSFNSGDAWTIAAAASSAMYILRLDTAAKAVGDAKSVELNAACLWVVTLFSGLWSLGTAMDASLLVHQMSDIVTSHPWEMIYLSAVTTALANWIQTKSQKEVSAERASVIYAMDPVYGAVFSNLILGETLTSLGYVGAGLITIAAATNALLDLGPSDAPTTRKSQ